MDDKHRALQFLQCMAGARPPGKAPEVRELNAARRAEKRQRDATANGKKVRFIPEKLNNTHIVHQPMTLKVPLG